MLRIDRIMKERHLTASELAKRMNVTSQYVSEVANEKKNITIAGLSKFAQALDVIIAALFDGYYEPDMRVGDDAFTCPYCGHIIKICKGE